MSEATNSETRHLTLRRGFVVLVGLLVLTLYGLWAAYGAAPTSLSFLTETPAGPRAVTPMAGMEVESLSVEGMAVAGHGAGVGAMTPDEFQEATMKFVDDLSLPDGSVRPTREWTETMEAGGAAQGAAPMDARVEMDDAGQIATEEPIDVYLLAQRFSYEPGVLRLTRGVRYRFRMMSIDVNHGASIHTGFAGHIMRRPAMVLTEMVMLFSVPGEFMIYCTVYCGAGHDQMKGKIIVE
jgi:cytochrome c oxidase subunit II